MRPVAAAIHVDGWRVLLQLHVGDVVHATHDLTDRGCHHVHVASPLTLIPRFRRVWRQHPWVFAIWLVALSCALAAVVGLVVDGGKWKYLAMMIGLLLGVVHRRLVVQLTDEVDKWQSDETDE